MDLEARAWALLSSLSAEHIEYLNLVSGRMTYPFLFLLLVGASYRIYRFIGRDDITEGLRLRLPDRVRMPLSCPWCAGSWLSFLVVAVYWYFYGLPLPILWGLAVGCVVGLIGSNLDE